MDIFFKRAKLAKVLNSNGLLTKEFGEENARCIMRRLTVLAAASTLADIPLVPPERCHPLKGNRRGYFAVDVKQPYRIIFAPEPPQKKRTRLSRHKITAITILDIIDYH